MALNPDAEEITEDISPTSWVSSPTAGDPAAAGATIIRKTRSALQQHFGQEHVLGDEDTGGKHVVGSAKVFVQETEPSAPEDYEKGRVWYDSGSGSLRISDGNLYGSNFLPGLNAYTGLIAMSVKEPTPATDGWAVCDGSLVTDAEDNGIWVNLIDVLTSGSGTAAYLPDLQNKFVRGVDAEDARAPALDGSSASFNSQEDAFQGHKHVIDHDHDSQDFTTDKGDFTPKESNDTDILDAEGNLVIRNPAYDTTVAGLGGEDVASERNLEVDLRHDHIVSVDLNEFTGDSGDPKTDGGNGDPRTADETRPDNVALYYVIKL